MPAELIDGKRIAQEIRAEVAERVKRLVAAGVKPGLSVILVGDDPASAVYVGAKGKATEEAGMYSATIRLPASASQKDLLAQVDSLNNDPRVHGILVQMPLPKHLDAEEVILRIDPQKTWTDFIPSTSGRC